MPDVPGMNPEARGAANAYVSKVCNAFTPSTHRNAYTRRNGADAVCTRCQRPQHQHWLRQLLAETHDANAD